MSGGPKHYSGGGWLNVVSQIRAVLSHGGHDVDTLVLIQKDAPCELLLGPDTQSSMGLSVLLEQGGQVNVINLRLGLLTCMCCCFFVWLFKPVLAGQSPSISVCDTKFLTGNVHSSHSDDHSKHGVIVFIQACTKCYF